MFLSWMEVFMNNTLHMNGHLSKLYFGTIKHSGAFSGSSSRLSSAVICDRAFVDVMYDR